VNTVSQVVKAQGRRQVWLAEQLDISPAYMTYLLNGRRQWTPELKTKVAAILGVPEGVLFLSSDCDTTEQVVA
jgi:plasmid maintenance system antidote protein VapI